MKRFRFLTGVWVGLMLGLSVLPAAATLSSSQGAFVAYTQPRSYYEARVNLAESEQSRIRRHLATVEAELRTRSVEHLNASQRVNRLARLNDLRAYRTRGEFPKNLDFPDRLIPYFIDAAGVPCAMGYLVIASGHGEFAQEIRTRMNNAYIGEIAAADDRLAAWGEENGMTLDEAAMVQPGYGPPSLMGVNQIQLDGLGRPWAFGGDGNNIGASAVFYRDSSQWKLHSSLFFSSGFCVSQSGKSLGLEAYGATWNGKSYSFPFPAISACKWARNDSDAWVGTRQGLVRLRRTGTLDTLVRTQFTTTLASDTVTALAIAGGAVWAATARGVYRRGIQGGDTGVTTWDSLAVWGKKITGIKASGASVWLGIEGQSGSVPTFSTRGLRRFNGTGWSALVASQSSLQTPGDTIYALAERDTSSIWVATPQAFSRFNGNSTVKVANIPSGLTVYDMVGNLDGFYAGTSNGVYQFRNDSLVHLGQPAVSLRPGIAREGRNPAFRLRVLSRRGADPTDIRSLLGRKACPRAGMGVYITAPREP